MTTSDIAPRLVVAGSRRWVRQAFEQWPSRSCYEVDLVERRDELTAERLASHRPDYVFFVHWSWRIPSAVYQNYQCVGFHMTDLPFGRGGSPLQNLLMRGLTETRLTAFRVGDQLDAGPVYLKRPLTLSGRAEEIYQRAAVLAFEMIDEILLTKPNPSPQVGEPVPFARRSPAQSRIEPGMSLRDLYTMIRMLDADGYPHAFLECAGLRFEFTHARLEDGVVSASVFITRLEGSSE